MTNQTIETLASESDKTMLENNSSIDQQSDLRELIFIDSSEFFQAEN